MVNSKKLGLRCGILLGGTHLLWALFILIMPIAFQNLLNRLFGIHMMEPYRILKAFSFGKMSILVFVTFVAGLFLGWITGIVLNDVMKKEK